MVTLADGSTVTAVFNLPAVIIIAIVTTLLVVGIKECSIWPTIPLFFIHGKVVGGSEMVRELADRGELERMIKQSTV